ncbi:MAG: DUF3276 family protein [Chlorobiota bacterium]|nr:MAG: DUF3276 family protein [Chlorobiota bacterium]
MEKKRPTLFSQMVRAGKRTYFVDIEPTQGHQRMVLLIESQGPGHERHRVLIFEEDFPRVLDVLLAARRYLEENPFPLSQS